MRKERNIFLFAAIAVACLGLVISATPAITTGHTTNAQDTAAQAQSITGKIMSVEESSFTISVGAAMSNQATGQETNERTMRFHVDRNTTIDGKLQVGKTADVTYRENNGSYIAISVRVAP